MTKIYTLSHPDTLEIRYVDKTKFLLNDRLCKHMLTKEQNHRGKWIRKLKSEGKKPIIELIEEVDNNIWKETEIYWIAQFKNWGFRLLNATKGGECGIISPQCREAAIKSAKGPKEHRRGYTNTRRN